MQGQEEGGGGVGHGDSGGEGHRYKEQYWTT